jgi:hypothetical protein
MIHLIFLTFQITNDLNLPSHKNQKNHINQKNHRSDNYSVLTMIHLIFLILQT